MTAESRRRVKLYSLNDDDDGDDDDDDDVWLNLSAVDS